MTGPKLNEKSFVVGERSGTKASALYQRSSASKARQVLNLIRGLPVKQADEVLQFTDREIATQVRKVLASAVANAQHNDEQDPDELFVKACFADEGPTLKRFTPRARGRAGRINKRTSHITIVVDRLDEVRLDVVQARDAKRTAAGRRRGAITTGAASRRDRVERSRQRAAGLKSTGTTPTDDIAGDETDLDTIDVVEVQGIAISDWVGAAAPLDDGEAPDGYEIKGNADSMLYHTTDSQYYNQTKAEVYFDTVENAEAAGFSTPASQTPDTDTDVATDEEESN